MDKQKKRALDNTCQQFLHAGLGIRSAASIDEVVDEKIMGFGTTIDEKIFGPHELKSLLARQQEQSKGIDFRWDIKPLTYYTSPDENTAFFADEIFLHVNAGGKFIEMYLRSSIVLTYINNKWIVIHWHVSKPENVKSEKDTYGIESWKQKAEALEKLVEEKTAHLLKKNRELEIEAALERVRARALAMMTSEDLQHVLVSLKKELNGLQIPNVMAATIYLEQDDGSIRMVDLTTGTSERADDHLKMHKVFKKEETDPKLWIWKLFNSKKKYFVEEVVTADFERVIEFLTKLDPEEAKLAEKIIRENKITKAWLPTVRLDKGRLNIDLLQPPEKEIEQIMLKLGASFDLAYKRFLDLQKAEAQAKEAQVETGLERVRSRSLAMHKSDELKEVIRLVLTEIRKLDILAEHAGFYIDYKLHDDMHIWLADPNIEPFFVTLPYFNTPTWNSFLEAKANKTVLHTDLLDYDEKNKFYNSLFGLFIVPEEAKKFYRECKGLAVSTVLLDNIGLYIENFDAVPYTDDENKILIRFAKVFEQTYTRFLDLQKAEAQAREAQIEAALERVRSRTMAMYKSEELPGAATLLFDQVQMLGMPAFAAGYCIWDDDKQAITLWMSSEGVLQPPFKAPTTEDELFIQMRKGHEQGKSLHVVEMGGEELAAHYQYMRTLPIVGQIFDSLLEAGHPLPSFQVMHQAYFSKGFLLFITYERVPNAHDIFERFANVFEQTYTRFLDLQKAEAQAREAQIEAALERVRSRTMAMHKSQELNEAAELLYHELSKLGIEKLTCGYTLLDAAGLGTCYMANPAGNFVWKPFQLDHTGSPGFVSIYESWIKQEPVLLLELAGPANIEHNRYLAEKADNFPLTAEQLLSILPAQTFSNTFNFRYGYLLVVGLSAFTNEQSELMIRFTKVFEQTYIRFLDLQKAEAQAREAQIELGLEMVRSRGMAMQSSEELAALIGTVFTELTKLDLILTRCVVWIIDPKTQDAVWWMANSEDPSQPMSYFIPYHEEKPWLAFMDEWKKQTLKWVYDLKGQDKKDWDDHLFSKTGLAGMPKFISDGMKAPERVLLSASFNNFGGLNVASLEPLSDEHFNILLRFAKVFDLTYTRFNDLKKAEASAREALIEASLERMRARSMAMHKTDELLSAAQYVHEELSKLGINSMNVSYAFVDEQEKLGSYYSVNPVDQKILPFPFVFPHTETEVMRSILSSWKKQAQVNVIELDEKNTIAHQTYIGEHIKQQLARNHIPFSVEDFLQVSPKTAVLSTFNFSKGYLFNIGEEHLTESQQDILLRVTRVFEQTYTRFLDLQKAEASAREAKIEAALERVRARALAMQEPEELLEVAQVLRNEMGALGIEELETASIYIHEKGADRAECWYAIKDTGNSKKMISDQFRLNLDETWVGNQMKEFYLSNHNQASIVMQGAHRKEWINYCYTHSSILNGYYGETIPDRTYHLYKFSDGYIGAAANGEISVESWRLLSRAASVFSLAYSRFKDLTQARNDLQRLKEEKQRAESALKELRTTQTQLIQAEKMASLGELTAGIAHEIQNPLNFVNNFSELNNELLAELKDELGSGNLASAVQLAEDIAGNEVKINLHGKRADSIVKSMLQHSRVSTGTKELTDINALAEEFLRLSFHGFRAKDKSFNATINTTFDKKIGKVELMPQDIGRVLLNLFNNSFYAVNEKKKKSAEGYEPLVQLTTAKTSSGVEITVKDNGTGMPEKLLNKIYQPFFTTKPTGEGTGLGLSLSYDIITKGHGGDLKVYTKEGEGATFIVELPS